MLECVGVCWSVLQCVAASPLMNLKDLCVTLQHDSSSSSFGVLQSVFQCIAVCSNVLQCVAVCCSMLQCVAMCCSALQSIPRAHHLDDCCCSVLQCVAV